jgi:hypothetical protein
LLQLEEERHIVKEKKLQVCDWSVLHKGEKGGVV